MWGNNIPVGWAFGIINFVWWIGIGHAGTLISAILLLFQQKWRTVDQPLRRGDDAVRGHVRGALPAAPHRPSLVRATGCSRTPATTGHLAAVQEPADVGRVRGLHLLHHLAAVLVPGPDPRPGGAARLVARARCSGSSTASSRSAGAARAGTGTTTRSAYLLLAGLSTPLVLSVHTIVSFDFAVVAAPRLAHHDLPALLRRRRRLLRLRDGAHAAWSRPATSWASSTSITDRHLENMNKVMLATGLIVVLRLHDGALHRLVQRQPVRVRTLLREPRARPVRRRLLADDVLQRASCRKSSGSRSAAPASRHVGGRASW